MSVACCVPDAITAVSQHRHCSVQRKSTPDDRLSPALRVLLPYSFKITEHDDDATTTTIEPEHGLDTSPEDP